jgi:hypothetical protein
MATPAKLVETLSATTGVPLATVIDIDRKLVTARLRTKTGRGRSAARMTALDAARLLTGVLASPQANMAAEAVALYGATAPDEERSSAKLYGSARLRDLAALPARHSFVEALAALIASAATGTLAAGTPSIEVFAFTRAVRGRIRVAGLPSRLTASVEYVPVSGRATKDRADANAGDLEQSRRITERTILPIARLLVNGRSHERD